MPCRMWVALLAAGLVLAGCSVAPEREAGTASPDATGSTSSPSPSEARASVPDLSLEPQWTASTAMGEAVWAVEPSGDGGVIAVGSASAANRGFVLERFGVDGQRVWSRLGPSLAAADGSVFGADPAALAVTGEAVFVAATTRCGDDGSGGGLAVSRLTLLGEAVWTRVVHCGPDLWQVPGGIGVSGGVVGVGSTDRMQGQTKIASASVDGVDAETGELLWQVEVDVPGFGTPQFPGSQEQLYGLVAAPDGGFYAAGGVTSEDGDFEFPEPDRAAFVLALTTEGALRWLRTFGAGESPGDGDTAFALDAQDDRVIVAGTADGAPPSLAPAPADAAAPRAWVTELTPSNELVWTRTDDDIAEWDAVAVVPGGALLAGQSSQPPVGRIGGIDASGGLVWADVLGENPIGDIAYHSAATVLTSGTRLLALATGSTFAP